MSLKTVLLHALGTVAGILIPGASASTANLTHSVQQTIANVYGIAAQKLAGELKLDTTGMTGAQKIFTITERLVATAVSQGFRGDLNVLEAVCLDVAQSAYRASEPSIGAGIIALATALHVGPALTEVAELVAPIVQAAADAALPPPALAAVG